MKLKKTALVVLVKKAGIDPESEAWKAVTGAAAPEESDDELPAVLTTALDNGLLGLEAAKVHPEVEAAFKGKLFNQVDTKLSAALKVLGLDDTAIKAALDGKATPDKVGAAIEAATAKVKGEGKHSDQQREQAWVTEKTALEQKLATANTAAEQAQQQAQGLEQDYALSQYLGDTKRFPLRTDLPNLTRYAKSELLTAIERKGAKLVIKDGQPTLVMKDDPEKPFHDTGAAAPLNLDDFTKTTLDGAGFIAKQVGNQNQLHNQQHQQQPNQPPADAQAAASMAANLAIINQAANQPQPAA